MPASSLQGNDWKRLGTLCITLAGLWYADRDGPQGVFLQPIAPHGQEKQRGGAPEPALPQTAGSYVEGPWGSRAEDITCALVCAPGEQVVFITK